MASKKKHRKTKKTDKKKKVRKVAEKRKLAKKRDLNKQGGQKVIKKQKVSQKIKQNKSFISRLTTVKNVKRVVYWGTIFGSLLWLFWGIPVPTQLSNRQVPVSTKLFDRNGKLIYEIYADKRSTPVKLEEVPNNVKYATLSIEDKDFYKHSGISFTGIVRAAYKTIFRQKLEGGSTLTQQLVKNTLLTPERTIKRKIREFALTMAVEAIYTKDQIFEMYLNQIPYGGTAYGIGAASELYFGKNAQDLTLAEAALLTGLPAAPSRYSPFGSHPELAKDRQETVLRLMVEDEYITQEEADEAKDEELKYAEAEEFQAPHFALWIKEQLAEKYGDAIVEKGGLRVTTTLDLDIQDFAQEAVATEVAKLKKLKVGNGATMVTKPGTGEILAMVGSKDYFAKDEDGKVNIILASRQPGSSIKPLNYALALKDKKITPSTVLADVPTCFSVPGTERYCPRNYDFDFHGGVQARFALGNSYNIPAVRVLALNGIENFIEFAKKMGITTFSDPENYGLSLTLGGGEVRPFDMAEAFGVFANSGQKVPLVSILKVEDWKGDVLEEFNPEENEGEEVLSPEVSFLISHILEDNNARSAAFGSYSQLVVKGHPEVSVKTGTTNDLRDNWTIGYTADALVVVWVGNNDNSAMSGAVSGVSGASPIWNKVMKHVLDNIEEENPDWLKRPKAIVEADVCTTSGIVPPADGFEAGCPTRHEYFLADTIPTQIKGGFQDVRYDNRTGLFANEDTPPEEIHVEQHNLIFDPLDTFICFDCNVQASSQSATVRYPMFVDNNIENPPQLDSETQ